jgi:hypothetical protein
MSCENCRKTERNLAAAYIKITQLLDAERDFCLAEDSAQEAAQAAAEQRDALTKARREVAVWLEAQR